MRNEAPASGTSRRAILEVTLAALASAVPAAAGFAERSYAQTKAAQNVVQYRDHPNGSAECDKCVNFIAPASCKVVANNVKPNGWCLLFAPKQT